MNKIRIMILCGELIIRLTHVEYQLGLGDLWLPYCFKETKHEVKDVSNQLLIIIAGIIAMILTPFIV